MMISKRVLDLNVSAVAIVESAQFTDLQYIMFIMNIKALHF